jgi:peptidoglycan/LPS O-acetylase OafA/YrhL
MKKLPLIDLVRSFAILAVLAHHLGLVRITTPLPNYPLEVLWFKLWANGYFGVSLFFVVSGFLITSVIAAGPGGLFYPDFRDFYSRRAGRIFPLLSFVCLFGYGLNQWITPSSSFDVCLRLPQGPLIPVFWISVVTFTENFFKIFIEPHGYVLSLYWGLLWSLAIEEQFYLFYPWVLKRARNRTRLAFFLIAVVIAGILSTTITSLFWHKYPIVVFNPITPYNSFAGFGLIAIGCLLYLAVEKYGKTVASDPRLSWGLSVSGLLLMVRVYWHINVSINFWWMALGGTLIASGLFLFLLGALHWNGWGAKGWIFLGLPGRFSYGGYLLHSVVLFALWPVLTGRNGFTAFFIFSIATTLVSGVSFYWFEMPANNFVRKLFARD